LKQYKVHLLRHASWLNSNQDILNKEEPAIKLRALLFKSIISNASYFNGGIYITPGN
jgi:hypothetical protein